jgi:hypothetical protein
MGWGASGLLKTCVAFFFWFICSGNASAML